MKKVIDVEGILALHQEGRSQRWIAKHYQISRHSVKKVTSGVPVAERKIRTDKITIPEDVLISTYEKCDRWAERTHELLRQEGYEIAYSTLTKRLREISDYNSPGKLAQQYKVAPGQEFQHDTSPIWVKVADKKIKLQASSLIFRFSRQRYLKFYPSFTRFEMQCFFHEALMYFGYSAKECIIDNTNLAVLKGSGRDAIFVPEMEMFAKVYSFIWLAHEINHSDRKASVESSFKTVNCNFLPGRDFSCIEDLNQQAFEWSKGRALKPVAKINQTPEILFALERPHLQRISPHVIAPYRIHSRKSDQYGFVSFRANFYYVGIKYCIIELLEFSEAIKIYRSSKLLWEYDLAKRGTKGEQIRPAMLPSAIKTIVTDKKTNDALTSKFASKDPLLKKYLDRSFVIVRTQRRRNTLIRHLQNVYELVPKKIFLDAIEKAFTYEIFDKASIDRLISLGLENANLPDIELEMKLPDSKGIEGLESREVFQKFKETPNPDLDKYLATSTKGDSDEK